MQKTNKSTLNHFVILLVLALFSLGTLPLHAQVKFELGGKNMLKKKKKKAPVEEAETPVKEAATPVAQFASDYHRDHAGTIFLSSTPLSPGAESTPIAEGVKGTDELYLNLLANAPMSELSCLRNQRLEVTVTIDDQTNKYFRILLDVPAYTGDPQHNYYHSFKVLGNDANWNQSESPFLAKSMQTFLKRMAKLNSGPHTLQLTAGSLTGGRFELRAVTTVDQVAGNNGAANGFQERIDDMVAAEDAAKAPARRAACEKLIASLKTEHVYSDDAMRKLMEAQLVSSSFGMVKRAKVFIYKTSWGSSKNKYGNVDYNYLPFHYVVEDQQGNFYLGVSSMRKEHLAGGIFNEEAQHIYATPTTEDANGKRVMKNRCQSDDSRIRQAMTTPEIGKQWFAAE